VYKDGEMYKVESEVQVEFVKSYYPLVTSDHRNVGLKISYWYDSCSHCTAGDYMSPDVNGNFIEDCDSAQFTFNSPLMMWPIINAMPVMIHDKPGTNGCNGCTWDLVTHDTDYIKCAFWLMPEQLTKALMVARQAKQSVFKVSIKGVEKLVTVMSGLDSILYQDENITVKYGGALDLGSFHAYRMFSYLGEWRVPTATTQADSFYDFFNYVGNSYDERIRSYVKANSDMFCPEIKWKTPNCRLSLRQYDFYDTSHFAHLSNNDLNTVHEFKTEHCTPDNKYCIATKPIPARENILVDYADVYIDTKKPVALIAIYPTPTSIIAESINGIVWINVSCLEDNIASGRMLFRHYSLELNHTTSQVVSCSDPTVLSGLGGAYKVCVEAYEASDRPIDLCVNVTFFVRTGGDTPRDSAPGSGSSFAAFVRENETLLTIAGIVLAVIAVALILYCIKRKCCGSDSKRRVVILK
jgi:hypothetical protein